MSRRRAKSDEVATSTFDHIDQVSQRADGDAVDLRDEEALQLVVSLVDSVGEDLVQHDWLVVQGGARVIFEQGNERSRSIALPILPPRLEVAAGERHEHETSDDVVPRTLAGERADGTKFVGTQSQRGCPHLFRSNEPKG